MCCTEQEDGSCEKTRVTHTVVIGLSDAEVHLKLAFFFFLYLLLAAMSYKGQH